MSNPKCNVSCEIEVLKEQDICCFWCGKYQTCPNPCKNHECRNSKEDKVENPELLNKAPDECYRTNCGNNYSGKCSLGRTDSICFNDFYTVE